ncbi:hypothetical protein CPter91_3634 [Collimonas pratensis]|uniref:Uncharacterized protein n=1 Tax=Collimonas pratensis TaxID=279113 RepID=A0A127Q7Y3_9BURK|nr:hypothetical protein CPter91_3634 [Collimonas pratensis]
MRFYFYNSSSAHCPTNAETQSTKLIIHSTFENIGMVC